MSTLFPPPFLRWDEICCVVKEPSLSLLIYPLRIISKDHSLTISLSLVLYIWMLAVLWAWHPAITWRRLYILSVSSFALIKDVALSLSSQGFLFPLQHTCAPEKGNDTPFSLSLFLNQTYRLKVRWLISLSLGRGIKKN